MRGMVVTAGCVGNRVVSPCGRSVRIGAWRWEMVCDSTASCAGVHVKSVLDAAVAMVGSKIANKWSCSCMRRHEWGTLSPTFLDKSRSLKPMLANPPWRLSKARRSSSQSSRSANGSAQRHCHWLRITECAHLDRAPWHGCGEGQLSASLSRSGLCRGRRRARDVEI